MLSHWDCEEGKVVHRSANACLCPLYAVEGMHVVTVEGGWVMTVRDEILDSKSRGALYKFVLNVS